MNAEIRDVIEAHRLAVGAESVHVTLGDGATAEGLARSFDEVRAQTSLLNAFSAEERLEAQVARLRKLLRKIDRMARGGDCGSIIRAVDMIPDVVMVDDLHCMAGERRKRGEPLPEGLEEWLKAHPLKD